MNRAPTTLRLPSHLPFPLTVTSFLVKPDSPIRKHDSLLVYKFSAYVSEEQDEDQEEKRVRKEMVEQFDSPWEGILTEWLIEEGAVVSSARYTSILLSELSLVNLLSQSSNHVYTRSLSKTSVRFVGPIYQCTCPSSCDANLPRRDYTGDVSTQPNISMSHDNFDVKVTYDVLSALTNQAPNAGQEAARIERQTLKRLLTSRKLSLIVDLDQTLIHATVDPTVGEWMRDTSNANYSAVKHVQAFQLEEGGHLGPCWYFVKVRPGLSEFLEEISKMYELHVYTMGTRAYADAVAKIVDPHKKYFGDRVLSRDESGSNFRSFDFG